MGSVLFKVSDLTGEIVRDESELSRLTIDHHPNFETPIELEVLPEEIEGRLPETQDYVAFSYTHSGTLEPQRFLMPLDEFNALFPNDNADATIMRVQEEQQQAQAQPTRRGRRQQTGERRQRVNWASPDRAGEPHPGRVSPAEQAYVREHLEEVNARLAAQGHRQIDPTDLEMQRRYDLTPPSPTEEPV